jgi:hypothetical protein
VILFKRGCAGWELIPSQTRPDSHTTESLPASVVSLASAMSSTHGHTSQLDVLDSFKALDAALNIPEIVLPTTTRFTTVGYTDASFAVGNCKDSISGFVIYVNDTPVMWGSICQSTGGDSTCSVEFRCCQHLLQTTYSLGKHVPFSCVFMPQTHPLYMDTQATQSIATNDKRMGKFRHISIRYHLVHRLALNGDIILIFCVTDDMIADLLTKILSDWCYL